MNSIKASVKRKNYYLDENKIQRARRILKTRTETETIDRALDLVLFRFEIRNSLKQAAGRGEIVKVF